MEHQESTSKSKLRIWASDWGLPSMDPDCLSVITYSKFVEAPIEIEETIPSKTVTGRLPELLVEESVITSPLNILGIFRRDQCNADYNLKSIDQADTLAFSALVEEKLKPGLQSCLWLNSGNYVNVTRKAYAKSFGFFRTYWDLPNIRNKIELDLRSRSPGFLPAAECEAYWNQETKMCITLLSKRLGRKEYFFGSTPSTFDAIAFGNLALLMKAPLVSTDLKNHLLACDNLCKFCGRISQRYLKDDSDYWSAKHEQERNQTEKLEEELTNRRNIMAAFAVAVAINIMYLITRGMISPKKLTGRGGMTEVEEND